MRIKVKLGEKGQLVIPKVVRESVGLRTNSQAILEVKEKKIEIMPFPEENLVDKARNRAKKYGGDLRKLGWIYGDKLYEEVFD
ncbi:MAG: AbrB/MazE/SpoVT family DNA-binding domain-containing protein [Candidatus Bathyarchaeia archaeon]